MEKKLSEITRTEWITFNWIDNTNFVDTERMMIRGLARTPDEAAEAMEAWDSTEEERKAAVTE